MTLNLIFTKQNVKKRNKFIKEFKQAKKIANLMDQNKLKYNDMMLRNYY